MPSKRPLCIEENDYIQSKRAKMVTAIQKCMKNKPIVKLINIDDKINQKKLLFEAIESHDVKSLEELLKIKLDLNIQDEYGFHPLHIAVNLGYLDIVKILVRNGANVNITFYLDQETPIKTAVSNGHYDISKYLLENGAEVNSDDFNYYGPLMLAVMDCRVDMVKLLLVFSLFMCCMRDPPQLTFG